MKLLIFAFLLVSATVLPLHADDWLTNGDFSSNADHWYGEAKWPADFTPSDPFAKPDPLTAQGMIIPLKSAQWTKELQDFKGKGTNAVLKITYVVSPGLKFSQKPEDYQNMPDKIGWDSWKSMDSPPNSWVIFISELSNAHGEVYFIHPDLTITGEQTYTCGVSGMTAHVDKTMALAFPPGDGTIVIHKIQMLDSDSDTDTK